MRTVSKIQGAQSFHIEISVVRIREGFNIRTKPAGMSDQEWFQLLEIESLALDILKNGLQDPLRGDLVPTDDDELVFYLTDGYRRYLAICWLLEQGHKTQANGKDMNLVEILRFPQGTTDKDRDLFMLSSGKKKLYNEMQMARGIKRLKDFHKMTSEEIGDRLGYSRQWVDNKLKLTTLPQDQQDAIERGELKSTNALFPEKVGAKLVQTDQAELQKLSDKFNNPMGTDGSKPYIPGGFETLQRDETIPEVVIEMPTPSPAAVTETKKALDEEMKSHATNSNYQESRPRHDQNDALPKVNFSQEKTEAEMELNEVKKMLDKINVICDNFPANMSQTADDIQRMCVASVRKVEVAQEIIKRAADER
jgi:hypothetical protein